MKAITRRPSSDDLSQLVANSVESDGEAPRFMVTEHGDQFRSRFHRSVESLGVTHIRCQVRTWQLNAKVERVFMNVKEWVRKSSLPLGTKAMQHRLNAYRDWHNRFRPHTAHDTLTPAEAERGVPTSETVTYRQKGGVELKIKLHRRCVRGDPKLAYPVILLTEHRSEAA